MSVPKSLRDARARAIPPWIHSGGPDMPEEKRSLGVITKIVLTVTCLVVAVVGVNFILFIRAYEHDVEEAMMAKAASFTAAADEAKALQSQSIRHGAVDMKGLLADAKAQVAAGKSYKETKFFTAIPVVFGWTAASQAAKREGLEFHVPAFQARNKENEPAAGSFRAKLLQKLTEDFKAKGTESLGEIDEETDTLHYMRAIKLDASCMMCHGDPEKLSVVDENGNRTGKDELGFTMENWKEGDMHGAYEVAMPLAPMYAQVASFTREALLVTVPLVCFALGGFVLLLRSMVAKPLNNLVAMVKEIATGDLTKRIGMNRGDEIGRLAHCFDVFVDSLHKAIGQVAGATNQVASAATEIASSAEEMALGLQKQGQQSQQVSAAVEELASSVTEVAKKSTEATKAATDSRKEADEGGQVVTKTVDEINAIAGDVTQSATAVTHLGKKSEQIGEIIKVINDIADQTNLLALNAAIEAARAGEHGRGFAVVADEVRKLAERTTSATEEVAKSIREIQDDTRRAVQTIEAGSQRVTKGVDLARSAGEALSKITAGSQNVTSMVESIAAAAEEQSAAAEQIARSVEQIDSVTRESSQGANQAAQAATVLSQEAEKLRGLVSRFKV
jgi:methyl-accepting chemotaxis protein